MRKRGQRPKLIPMAIGNDPTLWRFGSLQEALAANTGLLATGIQAGAEQVQADQYDVQPPEPVAVPSHL
jgi:hypothetical protein